MKLLIENWRQYLNEEVKFQEILKVLPEAETATKAKQLQEQVLEENPEMIPIPEDKLHITLIHQNILELYNEDLEQLQLPAFDKPIILEDVPAKRTAPGKESWVVWVENQEDLREYVSQVMGLVGGPPNPEPNRKFHISLANLTGNPRDSVG
jgi:2'-5' RNA ligase